MVLVPATLVLVAAGAWVVAVVAGGAVLEKAAVEVVLVCASGSEQAAVPSTTMAKPAFPISAIAIRRLIRRFVVIGTSEIRCRSPR
jgi:hypothetical protein